jgi:transcriptional regulator with XRE-family HTH domain
MTIGERIKLLREQQEKTQEELAKAAGIKKQTIYKYEAGLITNIPLDKVELIANELNTTPAYLLGWDKIKEKPATISADGLENLDNELFCLMSELKPEEVAHARAFVKWLIETREK